MQAYSEQPGERTFSVVFGTCACVHGRHWDVSVDLCAGSRCVMWYDIISIGSDVMCCVVLCCVVLYFSGGKTFHQSTSLFLPLDGRLLSTGNINRPSPEGGNRVNYKVTKERRQERRTLQS